MEYQNASQRRDFHNRMHGSTSLTDQAAQLTEKRTTDNYDPVAGRTMTKSSTRYGVECVREVSVTPHCGFAMYEVMHI